MKKSDVTRFLLVLVVCLAPAWTQSSNGSVRGTVLDSSQAVIPNVTVALTNTTTGVELKTITNDAGLYVFPSVIPGPYRLESEAPGMRKFEASVTVQVQQSATIDITNDAGLYVFPSVIPGPYRLESE